MIFNTNSSTENRIYLCPDGTIGATGMMAHLDDFTDRGTGYNYFDGFYPHVEAWVFL